MRRSFIIIKLGHSKANVLTFLSSGKSSRAENKPKIIETNECLLKNGLFICFYREKKPKPLFNVANLVFKVQSVFSFRRTHETVSVKQKPQCLLTHQDQNSA